MTKTEIIAKLKELFVKVFEGEISAEGLTEESHLINDIGMNSIALLYMAIGVEEEFGIKFTSDDFGRLNTVGDVVTKIEAAAK